MRVIILGNDGYIGYPLTVHLLERGHIVLGIDNYSRRSRVKELRSDSLVPIDSPEVRREYLKDNFTGFTKNVAIHLGLDTPVILKNVVEGFNPDAIIHLAEQPSAAWSMRDASSAVITQYENVVGTLQLLWVMKTVCPEAHLIKLGSMGEYGTPNCIIPEGRIPDKCMTYDEECLMGGLLFPRTAGSFYHLSKVHDTHNIEFACRNWNLRSTDIMQGVVYGLAGNAVTRLDYDECFGTVINRFCVQAISDYPLTVYGNGTQTRGFIHLKDSIACIAIALDNPPGFGEYRTLNQFSSTYSISQLAQIVCNEARRLGLSPSIDHLKNPRLEAENHYYSPIHDKLFDLGFDSEVDLHFGIWSLLSKIITYKSRVIESIISPKIDWRRINDTNQ